MSQSIGRPLKAETDTQPIDRQKPADVKRRRFPNFKDSEFPPKLGQSMCSINRTQFGRKKKVHTEKETPQEAQEHQERILLFKRKMKMDLPANCD